MLGKKPPELIFAAELLMIAIIMIVLIPVAMISVKSEIKLKGEANEGF